MPSFNANENYKVHLVISLKGNEVTKKIIKNSRTFQFYLPSVYDINLQIEIVLFIVSMIVY